ncbi:MAG: TetR/AcrR family transcriptional regulator [Chitinophagales bacterium]|nr:TetR/AcrR family transcriptional regulator [Chitinophagales bacterium]
MGRKATTKIRSNDVLKKKHWVSGLILKIQERDISNLTIDELSLMMSKSKSTVYEYFQSKDEVIELAVEVHLDNLRIYPVLLKNDHPDPVQQYREFLMLMCKGAHGIKASFLEDLKLVYPKAWSRISQFLLQVISDQKNFYLNGMKRGVFQEVSATLLSQLDYHFVFDIMANSKLYQDETMEQMVQDYLHVKFEGLVIS